MAEIIECNFSDSSHCAALVELMNHYMADDMGGKLPPHTGKKAELLVEGLSRHPSKIVLLAKHENEFVGLSNSFINFGTFHCKPFVNIHDVVIRNDFRGKGIGRLLLRAIIERAAELDCGKVTLEVREDNVKAQALYKSLGFDEGEPPMRFWSKYF